MTMFDWQVPTEECPLRLPETETKAVASTFKSIVRDVILQQIHSVDKGDPELDLHDVVRFTKVGTGGFSSHRVTVIGEVTDGNPAVHIIESGVPSSIHFNVYVVNNGVVQRGDVRLDGEIAPNTESEVAKNKALERELGLDLRPVPLQEILDLGRYMLE